MPNLSGTLSKIHFLPRKSLIDLAIFETIALTSMQRSKTNSNWNVGCTLYKPISE